MHDPSLVPSDLAAGLLLLAQRHKQQTGTKQPGLLAVKVDTLVEVSACSASASAPLNIHYKASLLSWEE